jgi:FkbM family methyltransferase
MADLRMRTKVLLRSRSLEFMRHYFQRDGTRARHLYDWDGMPVAYRSGTSDAALIYSILLKEGRRSEYAVPPEATVDHDAVGVVLDIGANIGVSSLYLARLFPRATIHAFEPEPGNCEILRANAAAHPRLRVHEVALGAEDGSLTLFDSDDAANQGGFSAHSAGINPARSKVVPVRHAGRLLAELGVDAVGVIKIDTEGAEWEILTALDRKLLSGVHLIMGELHGRKDFALLDYLQPMFHIGMRKHIGNRLFNFYAVNRAPASPPS